MREHGDIVHEHGRSVLRERVQLLLHHGRGNSQGRAVDCTCTHRLQLAVVVLFIPADKMVAVTRSRFRGNGFLLYLTVLHRKAAALRAHIAPVRIVDGKVHRCHVFVLIDGVERYFLSILRDSKLSVSDGIAGGLRLDGTQVTICRLINAPTGKILVVGDFRPGRKLHQLDRRAEGNARWGIEAWLTAAQQRGIVVACIFRIADRLSIAGIIHYGVGIRGEFPLAGERQIISRHVKAVARRNNTFIFCVAALPALERPISIERHVARDQHVFPIRGLISGGLGLRRNALAAVVVFRQLEAAARAPAGVVRKLVGQRVLLLRNKCPEARQRAVPRHVDKFCLADHNITAGPAAPDVLSVVPAGEDPLAGNRSAIFRACAVDGRLVSVH